MPAGTITLTNNSTAVTGSGTAFAAELKANDFLVAVVGGTTYTLGVKSVESATALTLTTAYGGPTTGGVAWTPIPNGTLVGITAQIAADTARAIRGLNYDKQNWQQVYSISGTVTVFLPDGSSYTGPSWIKLADSLADKPNKTDLGNSATRNIGTVENTVAAGNDSRFGTVNNKSGGKITTGIDVAGGIAAAGGNRIIVKANEKNEAGFFNQTTSQGFPVGQLYMNWYDTSITMSAIRGASESIERLEINLNPGYSWQFTNAGVLNAPGPVNPGSDERHKSNIVPVKNPLVATMSWRGATYDVKDGAPSVGLIAQDVEKFCPEAISVSERIFKDESVITDFKNLNVAGVAAAYHTEAIKELFGLLEMALDDPDACRDKLVEIRRALTQSNVEDAEAEDGQSDI